MSEIRTIKPVDGRRVRFPDTGRVLPPEGATVAWGSYWHRRLDAGDVVIIDDPAPADPAALGAAATAAPDASAASAKVSSAKVAAPAPVPQPAVGAAATAAPDPAAAVKDA